MSCKCDTNRAGHFTLDAHASRPVACVAPLTETHHISGKRVGVNVEGVGVGRGMFPMLCGEFCQVVFLVLFLAATKQLYEWFSPSVRLSVCLSVTPFWPCYHHHIIMKFSGVITKDQGKVHAKGQGQRSKVKVTEVTTQLNRFRTVTPVWIHIWWWNEAYSFIVLRRGALLFFKVIRQISRSHGSKNRRIWPRLGVSGL